VLIQVPFFHWGWKRLFLILVPVVMGWVLVVHMMRQRKRARVKWQDEVCMFCGYDLRGTPLRCPECGQQTRMARYLLLHPVDRAICERGLRRPTKRSV
jgi:hypothetical protein